MYSNPNPLEPMEPMEPEVTQVTRVTKGTGYFFLVMKFWRKSR